VYFICRFLTQKRINEDENETGLHQENNIQRKKTEDSTITVILRKKAIPLKSINYSVINIIYAIQIFQYD
jgi:hypothetical protein